MMMWFTSSPFSLRYLRHGSCHEFHGGGDLGLPFAYKSSALQLKDDYRTHDIDFRDLDERTFLRTLYTALKSKLDISTTTIFLDELDFRLNTFGFSSLADVVYATSKLEESASESDSARIRHIYDDSLQSFLRTIEGYNSRVSPFAVKKYLHGLANSKIFEWESISIHSKSVILSHVATIMLPGLETPTFSPPLSESKRAGLIADVLISLGRLSPGMYKELTSGFKQTLFCTIENLTYPDTSIERIIVATSSLRVPWNDLPYSTKNRLLTLTEDCVCKMTKNELLRVISSFGFMRLHLPSTSKSFQKAIVGNLTRSGFRSLLSVGTRFCGRMYNQYLYYRIIPLIDAVSVGYALQSLGKMGYVWSNLPPSQQTSIYSRLLELSPYPPFVLSALFLGFKGLRMKWREIPEYLKFELQDSFPRPEAVTEHSLSNIIYSLGAMKASWKDDYNTNADLGTESTLNGLTFQGKSVLLQCIEKTAPRFTQQGLSNSIWGLAKMSVDWKSDLSPQLRARIENRIYEVFHSFAQVDWNH